MNMTSRGQKITFNISFFKSASRQYDRHQRIAQKQIFKYVYTCYNSHNIRLSLPGRTKLAA